MMPGMNYNFTAAHTDSQLIKMNDILYHNISEAIQNVNSLLHLSLA